MGNIIMIYKIQWNPDLSNPHSLEAPENSKSSLSSFKHLDFLNQFWFPLELRKIRIPLYIWERFHSSPRMAQSQLLYGGNLKTSA